MSCIVGVRDGDNVIMGADSALTWGNYIAASSKDKIFVKGNFVYGVCGMARQCQVLRYAFVEPPRLADQTLEEYLVSPYAMSLVDCLKEVGLMQEEPAETGDNARTGLIFALAVEGNLFTFTEDLSAINIENYIALGSGGEYAMGALHALKDMEIDPKDRVLKALEAASAHSPYVKPPFYIATIASSGEVEV